MSATNLVKPEIPTKTLQNRGVNYASKQRRMEEDEKELEEMMRKEMGIEDAPEDVEEDSSEDTGEDTSAKETKPEETPEDPEEKSFKKRYGDLRSHLSKKEKAWKEREAELLSQVGEGGPELQSEEDIEAWAKSNPEVASMIEAIAEKKASEKFAKAEKQFEELDLARIEADRTKAENQIRKSHSDFDTLRESDEFHDWVESQPKWVQDALYENSDDAASVVRVIDLYKVDNDLTPAAKKKQKKKAAETVGRQSSRTKIDDDGSASMIRESDVEKMSSKEFDERYEEIQTAMRDGKFIYDVSERS